MRNSILTAVSILIVAIVGAQQELVVGWVTNLATGILTPNFASTVARFFWPVIISVGVTILALRGGFRVGHKSESRVHRWEDSQGDQPIQAFAVTRETFEQGVRKVVMEAVESKVNGQIKAVESKVDANTKRIEGLQSSVSHVHDRIDDLYTSMVRN